MFVFVLIIILLIFVKTAVATCPVNTTEWNSSCFSFYSNPTGFAYAELSCKNAGGHLVSIHDGLTNAVLAQVASKNFTESTVTDFWIGATNLMKPPTWNWTDGTIFDFNDWKQSEPQNISGNSCAALSMAGGFWTAQDCFKSKPFVCDIPSTPSYPAEANCTKGWTYFAPTHSCYGVNYGGFAGNWTASENNCAKLGAHLPSIHSFAEFRFILSYVFESWSTIWTGIYSPDSGRTWVTSDGSAADFLKYSTWLPGYPTNISGQRCAYIESSAHYVDADCTTAILRSLCKKQLFSQL